MPYKVVNCVALWCCVHSEWGRILSSRGGRKALCCQTSVAMRRSNLVEVVNCRRFGSKRRVLRPALMTFSTSIATVIQGKWGEPLDETSPRDAGAARSQHRKQENRHMNKDAVHQLLDHKDDNPRVVPAKFLSDYFKSIVHGNHTLFREYQYMRSTPYNRACFIRVFWKCFKHIGKNGDLLTVTEYHSLVCLLCADFPFDIVQKTARIILLEDAMDCLISFTDFLYAFQIQFYYEEFLDKLQQAYQALLGGSYRAGQVVVVPTLSTPQTKCQQSMQECPSQAGPVDDVDVHSFLEAALHIVHSSQLGRISCPPIPVIKDLLASVERVTFYGFLMALSKHGGINKSIATLPEKCAIMEETDQELSSLPSSRPKSGRSK